MPSAYTVPRWGQLCPPRPPGQPCPLFRRVVGEPVHLRVRAAGVHGSRSRSGWTPPSSPFGKQAGHTQRAGTWPRNCTSRDFTSLSPRLPASDRTKASLPTRGAAARESGGDSVGSRAQQPSTWPPARHPCTRTPEDRNPGSEEATPQRYQT